MNGWQTWLLIVVLCLGAVVAAWFVSSSVTKKRLLAEWPNFRDTVYTVDTLTREVVRIKHLPAVHDTVYVLIGTTYDTSYVASCDTANDRWKLHLEYAQPTPLDLRGAFQNLSVDVRDSVQFVKVTERVVDVRTEFPLWQTIAISTAALGLGVWLGSR